MCRIQPVRAGIHSHMDIVIFLSIKWMELVCLESVFVLMLYVLLLLLLFCRKFDASLKQRDPRWGIRDLEQVVALAQQNGLEWVQTQEMPANNLIVVFRTTASTTATT